MGFKATRLLTEIIITFITLVFAGIGLFSIFSRSMSPENYNWVYFIALLFPVILIINLFLALYWATKIRFWFFFSLIAILVQIPFISLNFQLNSKPHIIDSNSISIISFNVDKFKQGNYSENVKNLGFSIAHIKPDIICLQEFSEDKLYKIDSVAKFLQMPYYSVGRNGLGVSDLIIFSKYPIKNSMSFIYNNTHNGSMYIDIILKNKRIRIINCHLQTTNISQNKGTINSTLKFDKPKTQIKAIQDIYLILTKNSSRRALQASDLRKLVDSTNSSIILCGDLNDTPSSFTYKETKGELIDGFIEAGYGIGYTYKYIFKILRLDYIFHSKDFKCINYHSEGLNYSDHQVVYSIMKIE
ncbi:MAG: putative transrane endonuclease/exonuclease/phosphatase family protein [Bacteroidetes bacterium]|nr:putative transrane endonuclease/exonuclease/phosphatase family protein [Bacteroidota bacterium]